MNKIKHLLLLAMCCMLGTSAFAQKGARISGTIHSDAEGPLIMVNITERDKSNRIIEATVTDFEGNFSMVVKNTANELEISYIGYKTQRIPIGSRTVFDIKMVEDKVLDEVIIEAKEVRRSGGLDILEREMTHATQKISMEEMEGLSFASVDEALQGQIAGLDVVMGSGDLGSGTQMRLRGVSMLEGTDLQPLLVVDDNIFEVDETAIDLTNANEESFAELLMINTEDIAEIEVLKDAASCAIYGSAGANGVIKIKTKRGKRGPTRVNFTYKFKDKWTPKGINLLNGDEYTMLIKQALFNQNQNPDDVNIPELNYDQMHPEYQNYNNNTDWVDLVSQHGYRHDYTLNLNGGGEKATFRVSGSYTSETGQIIGQDLNTISTRLALDYFVSERIKVYADFAFSYTKQKRNTAGLLDIAQRIMPNMAVYKQDELGNNTSEYYNMLETATQKLRGGMGYKNPVAIGNIAEYNTENYSINPMITFEYNLLGLEDKESQLKYRGMVNLNASTSSASIYSPSELIQDVWTSDEKNKSESSDSKGLGFTTRHNLIFTPYLGSSDHYLTMTGQFELRTNSSNYQSSSSTGLPTGSITNSTIGSKLASASSGKGESRNISYSYQAHYSYTSKYMLGLTIRGEGLTSMGDDRKWVAFPSISGRWNVSDEPWMQWAKPVLSMLSIRPGLGLNGHAPGDNNTFNRYSASGLSYLGVGGYKMENIRLTDLRTTDKREFNVGSDFGFFDDKLTGAFNYYISTTYDQLVSNYKIPSTTGFSSLAYKNSGTMRNSGWELNLNTKQFSVHDNLGISMYFNIGKNYNEILEMEEAYLEDRNGSYDSPSNGTYLGRVQVGNPYGAIYGFRYKGVYRFSYKNWEKALKEIEEGRNGTCPIVYDDNGDVVYNADGTPKKMTLFYDKETQTTHNNHEFKGGDAIYEDINKDGTINQLDIVYLGNSNPKAQGGFGFTFKLFKKWTLKTNFTYRYGVDVVNKARMAYESMSSFENQSVATNWRWRKEGDITEIPRAVYGNSAYNYLGSDRYVEDASYLRLSYLQISYQFDSDFVKKLGLRSLSAFASADNLIYWSKYTGLEPEVGSGGDGIAYDNTKTPRPRSYTITLSLGF